MTAQTESRPATALTRRRLFAVGAAGIAAATLAACTGEELAATATRAAGTVAAAGGTAQAVGGTAVVTGGGTAQAALTQIAGTLPALGGTAQAVGTQAAGTLGAAGGTARAAGGTAQAAGSAAIATGQVAGSAAVGTAQVAGSTAQAAAGGDPASRNNRYQGRMPPMTIDRAKRYTATIVTNKGTMVAELYADTAPITVNNFVFLANEKFYDNVIFHRIVQGFVIQGGDPTGMGTGGPGYRFMDEAIPATRNYERGTLAMANSGPNTNGSQFFICLDALTAQMKLPKQYNLFGKVTEGLDTLDRILAVPRTRGSDGAQSSPMERIFMQTVTITVQ